MSRGRNTDSGAAQEAHRATETATDSARLGKGRWSARRKVSVVLEPMRGAELEATSRKYAVTAATRMSWRDAFLQGGQAGLKSPTGEVADEHRGAIRIGGGTPEDESVTAFAMGLLDEFSGVGHRVY